MPAALSVTGVSPPSGVEAGGTTVTVSGSGFTGASGVSFGATPATSFTVESDGVLTAVAPAGTGVVDVQVTTPAGTTATSSSDQYTYASWVPTILSDSNNSALYGISCPTSGNCVAVGQLSNSQAGLYQEVSGTWNSVPVPNAPNIYFDAVSCADATNCMATGSIVDANYNTHAVIDTLSGGIWTETTLPDSGSGNSYFTLYGVSCTSDTTCVGVGWYSSRNGSYRSFGDVLTRGSGGAWTATTTLAIGPGNTADDQLQAVSCTSATTCVAVGYSTASDGSTSTALIATLSGSSWSVADTSAFPTGASLYGVWCADATDCQAVGTAYDPSGSGIDALAAQLSGSTWSAQTLPLPSGGWSPYLAAVSCPDANDCTAVGTYADASGATQTLLETYASGHWQPSTIGTYQASYAVSCDSVISCVAAGTKNGGAVVNESLPLVATPSVTGLSPTGGLAYGGTTVTISGAGLTGATGVDFGGVPATNVSVNWDGQITATSPAGSGTVDVTVTGPGGTSATTPADQYTYVNPAVVTSVSPATGPVTGGTSVTITGSGFDAATSVSFGSVQASTYSIDSDSQITVTAPAGTAGIVGCDREHRGGPVADHTCGPVHLYGSGHGLLDHRQRIGVFGHHDLRHPGDPGRRRSSPVGHGHGHLRLRGQHRLCGHASGHELPEPGDTRRQAPTPTSPAHSLTRTGAITTRLRQMLSVTRSNWADSPPRSCT